MTRSMLIPNNDHYAKKLITHVIYLNLTVQDHTIDTASMLITQLNQHQMILEKTWMNKINLVIDMQIDSLRFSNFNSTSQKSIALFSSNKSITKWKSLTSTHILKRSFTFVTSQFSQNKKFIEQLKQRDATLTNVNSKSTFSLKSFSFNSMNIIIIIIIIINSYILVTSIRSTHEKLYATCIEWTKFSEIENHSQSIRVLHAVETVSFKTMYQICSRWSHVREWMF